MPKIIHANGHDGKYVGPVPEYPHFKMRTTDCYEPSPRKAAEGLDTGETLTRTLEDALIRARQLEGKNGVKIGSDATEQLRTQEQLKRMNRENREFWAKIHGSK